MNAYLEDEEERRVQRTSILNRILGKPVTSISSTEFAEMFYFDEPTVREHWRRMNEKRRHNG